MKRLILGLVLVATVCVSSLRAITLDEILLNEVLGKFSAYHVDGANSYALENLTYSGTATTAQINIEKDLLQLIGTSTDTFDLSNASYDTMGEIVAAIDALSDWAMSLDDCGLLYSDNSGFMFDVSTTSIGTDNDYDVKIDTDGVVSVDASLLSKRIAVSSDDADDEVRLRKIYVLPATNTDDVEIYKEDSDGVSTKLIDWNIGSNSTAQVLDLTASGVGGLDITKDYDLIIKVNGTAAQATDGTDYITILYKKK